MHQLKWCVQVPCYEKLEQVGLLLSSNQITVGTMKISGNSDHFRRSVCITKETQHLTFTQMSQIGMYTSQHDFSSVHILLRLLLFLELERFVNVFVTKFVDRFVVNRFVSSSAEQPIPHFGDVSTVPEFLWHKMECGILPRFSRKDPPTVSEERSTGHQNSMRKSTVTIASLIQCFKHCPRRRVHNNTTIDRQVCLRLHQTVHAQISRRNAALHAEISESKSRMHIQQ